ncbi:DsbA family protein [Kitasatospora gansuensis]
MELSGGPPGYPLRRTRLAFGGYQFALEQGCGDVYNNRVFDAYFEDWQDISDPVVLVRIATGIGLDGAAFRAALMSERYAARHLSAVAEAREKEEVLSCPTVAVGSWRASGVLGAEEIMAALRGMPDSGR